MKNFSNLYIFAFSSIMVIIVAALLSFVAEELRPLQERNVEIEKKLDILRSVDMTEGIDETPDKSAFVEEQFSKYISESFVVNSVGETVSGKDAFEITKNLKAELYKPVEERDLPIFLFNDPAKGTNLYYSGSWKRTLGPDLGLCCH